MGQRAFRDRLTDSIVKNYLRKSNESPELSNLTTGLSNTIENSFISGNLIDLNLEFDLDNPLDGISDINTALSRGILYSHIPKSTKINNLYLTIKSSNFGQGRILLHSNFYVLFGPYFIRNIKNIYIKLSNPINQKHYNDRRAINNILQYMCFKTIKLVQINSCLMYYIIPGCSEFSIVLTYGDVNFYEQNRYSSYNWYFEDLLFHPYSIIEVKEENFHKFLNTIEKTVPKEVNNIILPVIYFNDLNENLVMFKEFQEFLTEIRMRFSIMSIELKLACGEKMKLGNCLQFANQVISETILILSQFTYSYISFNFTNLFDDLDTREMKSRAIISEFKNIIKKYNLERTTLANHLNFSKKNEVTKLDDIYDVYDYTYYNKVYVNRILFTIFAINRNKMLNRLYRKKNIMSNILSKIFQFSKIYCDSRIDYSTKFVKNKKIVPFEISPNNIVVFEN